MKKFIKLGMPVLAAAMCVSIIGAEPTFAGGTGDFYKKKTCTPSSNASTTTKPVLTVTNYDKYYAGSHGQEYHYSIRDGYFGAFWYKREKLTANTQNLTSSMTDGYMFLSNKSSTWTFTGVWGYAFYDIKCSFTL